MYADDVSRRLVAVPVPSGTCMATLVEPGTTTPRTNHGVLVIPPLGIEHAGADRLQRHFADQAARLGHVVLTIEPVGTGDSTDLPCETDLVSAYGEALAGGVHTLVALGTDVTVFGIRFGALAITTFLAADAALRELVRAAVLIEPVAKGRNYRRELMLLGASTSGGLPEGWAAPAGSVLRPSDLAAINRLDVAGTRAPAPFVLVAHERVDPLPGPTIEAWRTEAAVEFLSVAFERIVIEDPELGEPLPELAAGVIDWMGRLPPADGTVLSPLPAPPCFTAAGPSWREDTVALSMTDGQMLHGIRTCPPGPVLVGLVLLSTGTNPRFGPARLHTVIARRLSALGVATLRIERRGAGVDGRTVDAYSELHVGDARTIDAAAAELLGAPRTVIAGMCSGAWAIWHAALEGLRASDVVLMNQIIFGEDSWDLSESSPAMAVKTRQSLGDLERWRKIFRGEIRVKRSIRNLARYAALATRNRFGSGATGLRSDLDTLAKLRTDVHFLFDRGESGLVYLNMRGKTTLSGLINEGRITIDVVSQAGHVFSSPQSVDWLWEMIARRCSIDAGTLRRAFPTVPPLLPPSAVGPSAR